MKILITSIIDLKRSAHNRLHEFIRYLSQKHDITVLSPNDWWKAGQLDNHKYADAFNEESSKINIEYFTRSRMRPIFQELISPFRLGEILKSIDYRNFNVHLNYNSLIAGYFVARKLKEAGIKTVYDVADDLLAMVRSSPQVPMLFKSLAGFVGSIAFKKNVKLANKITGINSSLLESLAIPSSKSKIIPNGVDVGLFKPFPSENLRVGLGLDNSFVLGYVGVLREWVDLDVVFSTVRLLNQNKRNIKVLIVGEEGGLGSSKMMAKEKGVQGSVVFTGNVAYNLVPNYISCMDACLIPFKENAVAQNAVPLKLFEYMACQRPVISTSLAGVKEMAGDRALYFSNLSQLKTAVTNIYENEGLKQEMGLAGREFVKEHYSWEAICLRLEEVLLEVAR